MPAPALRNRLSRTPRRRWANFISAKMIIFKVKCCEILEYDFSYLIREFIAKERHKSAFVILPESHAKIEENERAINAGMSSGAAANIFS